jgi:hypothetical protein
MSALKDLRDGLANRLALLPGVTCRTEFGGQAFWLGDAKFAALTDRALVLHLPPRDVTELFKSGQGRPFVSADALSRHGWIELSLATLSPAYADPWIEVAHRAAKASPRRGRSRKPAAARRVARKANR